MIDIVYLVIGEDTWQSKKRFNELKARLPFIQRVYAENAIDGHYAAAKEVNTSFFYVVDPDFEVDPAFKFDAKPFAAESAWVTRFKNPDGAHEKGVRILHISMFKLPIDEVRNIHPNVDFIYDYGAAGTKDLDKVATIAPKTAPDIIFIDLDEPFADKHHAALVERFGSRVKRSSGVRVLWQAHYMAAQKSTTDLFYVVDSDAVIADSFKFDYIPEVWDEKYVHVWNSKCILTGLVYGNGGVKLMAKKFFDVNPRGACVDVTLWIAANAASGAKYMNEIASFNMFYEDQYLAWRGAFREAAKLRAGEIALAGSNVKENAERLDAWLNIKVQHANAEVVMRGARDGVAHIDTGGELHFINDYAWLRRQFSGIKRNDLTNTLIETSFVTNMMKLLYAKDYYKVTDDDVRDALSEGQMRSKLWLINTLNSILLEKDIRCRQDVLIVGGWIGSLANLLFQQSHVSLNITSLDIDEKCANAANAVNIENLDKFKAITSDMYTYADYDKYTIVINTSAEHIPDLRAWLNLVPKGTCVILQSNDYDQIEEHINCVYSIDEFKDKAGLSEVFYAGENAMDTYTRYMLIGEV